MGWASRCFDQLRNSPNLLFVALWGFSTWIPDSLQEGSLSFWCLRLYVLNFEVSYLNFKDFLAHSPALLPFRFFALYAFDLRQRRSRRWARCWQRSMTFKFQLRRFIVPIDLAVLWWASLHSYRSQGNPIQRKNSVTPISYSHRAS